MAEPVPLLSLRGISKSFGRIEAIRDIDLDVFPGEIVALVGDNGAGKSTLIKVVTGVYQPSSGKIFFKGKLVKLKDVQASRRLGIEAVYQERALADQQEMWRNIFAGREPHIMSGLGTEFPPYITNPGEVRVTLEELIKGVVSAGIFIDFLIRYPQQLYSVLPTYTVV